MGGLETALEDLETEVRDLNRSIGNYAHDTEDLTNAVRDLISALGDSQKTVTVTNTFTEPEQKSDGEVPTFFNGFKAGERVAFVSSLYSSGVFGIVEPHDAGPSLVFAPVNSVPVRREDNGKLDRFPARGTILADNLTAYAPKDEPWYFGEPIGSASDWNRRVCEAAAEDKRTLEFTYRKPFSGFGGEEKRVVRVLKFEPGDVSSPYSTVEGTALDVDEYRSFRLDRIVGPVKVVK